MMVLLYLVLILSGASDVGDKHFGTFSKTFRLGCPKRVPLLVSIEMAMAYTIKLLPVGYVIHVALTKLMMVTV